MASTISTSFQFRLTGVTGTPFNARTRQNIKKRIANIVYLAEPTSDAVNLAYVGSNEITPSNNLFIGDRSDSIYANSRTTVKQEFISLDDTASSTTVANSNFLFTQEFVEAESEYIPLYYKHTLSSLVIPESVKVFDQNFNEVTTDKWKLVREYEWDDDNGTTDGTVTYYHIFNSLENIFNQDDGSYTVYFVQYTIVSGGTQTTTTEILDNEDAYIQASAEDFWHLTPGELKPWVYKYHYEAPASLKFPAIGRYAIKYLETKRMSVKLPTDLTDSEPWLLRVVNGTFVSGISGMSSTYSIPEFENQSFNPIEPYKIAAKKYCQKIDKRLLQLPHDKIQTSSMFTYVNIEFELDGNVEYAITSDPSKDGTPYIDFNGDRVTDTNGDEVLWSTDLYLGLDRYSGIIYVDFDILDSYDIYATYPYEEEYYTITSLMMNPIFDYTVQRQTRVIYIVPKNSPNNNTSTQTASVMWLKVTRAGLIEAVNQNGDSGNEDINLNTKITTTDGYKLTGVLDMHYSWSSTTDAQAQSPATVVEVIPDYPFYVESTDGFPGSGWLRAKDTSGAYRYFKYTSKTSTVFNLSSESTEVPTNGTINIPDGETVELVNFVNERTTSTDRTYLNEYNSYKNTGLAGYASMASQYFILAELAVNTSSGKENLSVIDVRQDGGGINTDLYDAAKATNPEVQWLNDYESFDGQVYPTNSVIVVKLPYTILDDFSLDNIKDIVSDKVPYGVYPLIRFYGYEPRIISILPTSTAGQIQVKWEKEGSEFTYDIWYARNNKGPWTRANNVMLTDSTGSYNSFTITGLSDGAPYLVKITMQDRYYSWWYGYSGVNSISGGLGLDEDAPVAPFGNFANFQFRIL